MKPTQLHTIETLENANRDQTQIDGEWVAARPVYYPTIIERLQLAWGVFTGKYDAVQWPKGQ